MSNEASPFLAQADQAALAERVHKGDPAAEEELVRFFRPRVLVVLAARTRDRQAARDLCDEVLMSVVCALREGRVREAARLAAFVHATARNLANNFIRARRARPQEDPLDPETVVFDPRDDLEKEARRSQVRRELESLDPTDRRILLLTLVEGYKPGEIARRLGLSPDVVRARKSRAVKKIVDRLGGTSRT